ncbi:MAG: glutamate racemase [Firmicutes bacterium]|nr:glutamate racemase [Bacillota bacterium]
MNSEREKPIGIFDSGLGGLTVVREIWRDLPQERITYFGDTARVPYGGRSAAEITEFNSQIIEFMLQEGIKAVIFACNTSSALALQEMRKRYPVPMFGIIKPGAKAALATSSNRRIGLLATEATVKSGAYERAILALEPTAQVFPMACPKLVPLIEKGELDSPETEGALQEYIDPLAEAGVDTLIYGCTHYPFLDSVITRLYPGRFKLVDPAKSCVREVREYLQQNALLAQEARGEDRYFVSGDPGHFAALGSRLAGRILPAPQKVDVFGENALKVLP